MYNLYLFASLKKILICYLCSPMQFGKSNSLSLISHTDFSILLFMMPHDFPLRTELQTKKCFSWPHGEHFRSKGDGKGVIDGDG